MGPEVIQISVFAIVLGKRTLQPVNIVFAWNCFDGNEIRDLIGFLLNPSFQSNDLELDIRPN